MFSPNKCSNLFKKYKPLIILIILLVFIVAELIQYDWILSEKYEHLNFPITNQLSAIGSLLSAVGSMFSAVFAFYAINISYRTWRNDKYLTYIQRLNDTHEQAFKQLNKILPYLKDTQYHNIADVPYKLSLDETKNTLNFEKYKNLLREYERFKSPYPYHHKLIKLLTHLEETYNNLGLYLLCCIKTDKNGVWEIVEDKYKQKADKSIKRLLKLEHCFSKTREKILSHLYQQIHKI
ncbi:hypothetical protein [Rodentibacter genomosp. 1]|nr:hypothetical protein [Rodentibacter genomosp. 1]